MSKKAAALLVLLVLLTNAYCVTSTTTLTVDGPFGLFGFFSSLLGQAVAFADPVPGGPGSGGDN